MLTKKSVICARALLFPHRLSTRKLVLVFFRGWANKGLGSVVNIRKLGHPLPFFSSSFVKIFSLQVGAENASAYGKSVLGQHVALRLKGSGNEAAVDIKSSDPGIGSALIQEVTALFR